MNDVQEQLELIQSFGPDYYDDEPIMKNMYMIQARGIVDYNQEKEDVFRQFSPYTATWGINLWEQELGLETIVADSIELRRSKVLAALYASGSMITRELMETIVNIFVPSKSAKVIQIPNEYAFDIIIPLDDVETYIPKELKNTVNKEKPAHLGALYRLRSKEWIRYQLINNISMRVKISTFSSAWSLEKFLIDGEHNLDGSIFLNGSFKTDGPDHLTDLHYKLKVEHEFGVHLVSTLPLLNGVYKLNGEIGLPYTDNLQHEILMLDGNHYLNGQFSLPYDLLTLRLSVKHDADMRCKEQVENTLNLTQQTAALCTVKTLSGTNILNGNHALTGNIALNQTLFEHSGLFRVKKSGITVEEVAI